MFDKLVKDVDDAVFQTVTAYMEEVMGGPVGKETHDTHVELQERVLVALLKKYRPENVIFVEEEENVPEQIIYGVFNSQGTWLCDVSGNTEGELFDDFVDAVNGEDDGCMAEVEFTLGQDTIRMIDQDDKQYILKKK